MNFDTNMESLLFFNLIVLSQDRDAAQDEVSGLQSRIDPSLERREVYIKSLVLFWYLRCHQLLEMRLTTLSCCSRSYLGPLRWVPTFWEKLSFLELPARLSS